MSTECPLSPEVFTAKTFRSNLKPIWCPGCGDYGVVTALYRALAAIKRPPHEIAFISGIRLLQPHPRIHDGLRFQHRTRPGAADRARH